MEQNYKICTKCEQIKPIDNFPIHYDWCFNCLNIKSKLPFLSPGRICKTCGNLKPIEQFDSSKWICQIPNISFLNCSDCRYKNKSRYYKKKEIKKEQEQVKRIIEEYEFDKWKSNKGEILDKLVARTKLSRYVLYKNREFVELADIHLKLKQLLNFKKEKP